MRLVQNFVPFLLDVDKYPGLLLSFSLSESCDSYWVSCECCLWRLPISKPILFHGLNLICPVVSNETSDAIAKSNTFLLQLWVDFVFLLESCSKTSLTVHCLTVKWFNHRLSKLHERIPKDALLQHSTISVMISFLTGRAYSLRHPLWTACR